MEVEGLLRIQFEKKWILMFCQDSFNQGISSYFGVHDVLLCENCYMSSSDQPIKLFYSLLLL